MGLTDVFDGVAGAMEGAADLAQAALPTVLALGALNAMTNMVRDEPKPVEQPAPRR